MRFANHIRGAELESKLSGVNAKLGTEWDEDRTCEKCPCYMNLRKKIG